MIQVPRAIVILLLIVLRPIFLAVLWPVAALVRFVTFASPLVLFFLLVILLHLSDPVQRSFVWSLVATMACFALASVGLTALRRKLREDPTRWFRRHGPPPEPSGSWQRRDSRRWPSSAIEVEPFPRSLPHLRRR